MQYLFSSINQVKKRFRGRKVFFGCCNDLSDVQKSATAEAFEFSSDRSYLSSIKERRANCKLVAKRNKLFVVTDIFVGKLKKKFDILV